MTSKSGVVMIKSPRQQGLMTTMERGCWRALLVAWNGCWSASIRPNGVRNRMHRAVIICWRRVIVLHLWLAGPLASVLAVRRVRFPDLQHEAAVVESRACRPLAALLRWSQRASFPARLDRSLNAQLVDVVP